MNNIKVNYPERFFSFKDGVDISNSQINAWIKDCIDKLEEDKSQNGYAISSGNTYVQVDRVALDDNRYYYDVMVSKNYETFETDGYEY